MDFVQFQSTDDDEKITMPSSLLVVNNLSNAVLVLSGESGGNYSSLPWYRYNIYSGVALAIAYAIVFITGFIGNFLIVLAVLHRGNRTMINNCVTNIFLANLAVADLLVIIACTPFTLVAHLVNREHIRLMFIILLLFSSFKINLDVYI